MTSPAPRLLNSNSLAFLLTQEDVDFLHADIEKICHNLFLVNSSKKGRSWRESIHPKNRAVLENVFSPQFFDQGSLEEKRKKLVLLQKELRSLPLLRVTLAFDPSRAFLEEIANWARRSFDPAVVLSVETEPAILGGVVVSFAGRYLDNSLRRRLQEAWPQLWPQVKEGLLE